MRTFVIQLHEEASSESSLELQLASSHQEVPVAGGMNINTVIADRNFVVQLYEAVASEISLELELASPHTHQELVVGRRRNTSSCSSSREKLSCPAS